MKNCPDYKSADWKYVESKLKHDQAVRMFNEYRHLENPEQEMARLLNPEINPNSKKAQALLEKGRYLGMPSERQITPEGDMERIYEVVDMDYVPMSTKLDQEKLTSYPADAPRVDSKIADNGTIVHDVFKSIARDKASSEELKKKFPQVTEGFISQAVAFVESLDGMVISEMPQSIETEEDNIAGTPDLILLRNDGTIAVYDFKTVHQQREDQTTLWDPKAHRGYKARRYSTQLLGYGEMVKDATGQYPTDYFVVPIEVWYNEAGEYDSGFKKIDVLSAENIEEYGYYDGAKRIIDRMLGKKFSVEGVKFKTTKDVTDRTITKLVGIEKALWGDLESKTWSAQAILNNPDFISSDGNAYLNERTGRMHRFKSKNKEERLNQIIQEVVNLERQSQRDVYSALKNYLQTGADPLSARNDTIIPKLFRDYQSRNFEVYDLTSIKGFENKEGWMVLQQKDRIDFLYVGTENFDAMLSQGKTQLFENLTNNIRDIIGESVHNTVGDLKNLEGTLIAAQFLKDNPKYRLGRISLYSDIPATQPYVVNPIRMYDVLKKINASQKIPQEVKGDLAQLLEVDRDRFMLNYGQAILDLYDDFNYFSPKKKANEMTDAERMEEARRKRWRQYARLGIALLDKGDTASDRAFQMASLKEKIQSELYKIREYEKIEPDSQLHKEYEHLTMLFLQLEGLDTYTTAIQSTLEKQFQGRNQMPGVLMQYLNRQIGMKKMDFRHEYINEYVNHNIPAFDKFFRASGFKGYSIKDRFFSPTTRFYEPLFERKMMWDESSQTQKMVNTYKLVHEKSDAFANLTPEQQEFHRFYRKQIMKAAKRAGMSNWNEYQIPLMTNSFSNSLYKNMMKKGGVKQAVTNWWEQMTENAEFLNQGNNSKTGQSQTIFSTNNWFVQQQGETSINKILGRHGNTITDLSQYENMETNLEKILTAFAGNAVRTVTMNELGSAFAAAHTAFAYYENNLFGNDFKRNREWVEDFNTILTHNQDLDAGTFENKAVKAVNRITSYITLAGNVKAGAVVAMGQELLAFSRSLSNNWINSSRYDSSSFAKATTWMMKNKSLASAIIDHYGVQDADSTALMSDLYQTGNKSIFRSKYLYSMFRLGDRFSKGNILLAMMHKDGSINAYSLDDNGKLVYNQDEDPRFFGEDGGAFLETVKEDLSSAGDNYVEAYEEDGKVDFRLKQGYDTKTMLAIQNEMALLFGGMDRDQRPVAAFTALGRLFFLHKHFFPTLFTRAISRKGEFDVHGNWEKYTDEEGKTRYKWTSGIHEGIFTSLFSVGKKLLDLKNKTELTEIEQDNLKKVMADVIVLGGAVLLGEAIAAALGDDNEATKMLHRSLTDLTMVYQLGIIRQAFQPVAIQVTYNTVESIMDAMSDDVAKKDGVRTHTLTTLVETPAVGRTGVQIYEMFEQDDE